MKKLLTYSCAALSAGSLLAETAWFATVEVDSLQTLQVGIESFCKATGIPAPPNLTSDALKELLPVPDAAALLSLNDPVRVFVVGDTEQPITQGGEPSFLFAITLPAEAKALQDQLAKLYTARRDDGNAITFSTPAPEAGLLPPNMVLSVMERNKALLATSKEAMTWFKQQPKVDAFLPLAGTQTVRACINMKQIALPKLPDGTPNPAAAMMADVEYLSLAVTPNAQAFSLTYGIRLKPGSALEGLMNMYKAPDAALWNGLPENALFGYVGPNSKRDENTIKFLKAYLPDVPVTIDPMLTKLDNAVTGDIIRYLAPTKDKKGLRLIDVDPIKDAAAVKEIIKTLDQVEASPGVKFKKEESRKIGEQTIERYSMVFDMAAMMQAQGAPPEAAANMGTAGMVMGMLSRMFVMELTVKDNYLLSAWGPANATDDWLPTLPFPAATVTLDKKIVAFDPTAKPLLGAAEVRLMPFLKQIVSMLPNAKAEHINLFAAQTDPIQTWTSRAADGTLVATIRVPVNEIAAFVKLTQQDMSVFQELAFAIFAAQMQQMTPPAAIPPPNF